MKNWYVPLTDCDSVTCDLLERSVNDDIVYNRYTKGNSFVYLFFENIKKNRLLINLYAF